MKVFLTLACVLVAQAASLAWTVSEAISLDAPPGLDCMRRTAKHDRQQAELHIVTFATATHTLAVMDDPKSEFDLATAARHRGVLAAVNGGYFHPNRTPLGLVVRQGVTLHRLERAPLLSGLVTVINDRPALLRVAEFRASASLREALQSGPFLIDRGRPVRGLNTVRPAARTVIFATDSGRMGLLVSQRVTLAEMAEILAIPSLSKGTITRALNLDGGSSTGMWVAADPPLYLREARDVRNFLAVRAEESVGQALMRVTTSAYFDRKETRDDFS